MPKDNVEVKFIGGLIQETKQVERNGVPVGLISGYIATWSIDRGDDQFLKGAFLESLQEHRNRNNRQIRFKDNHGRTVGGFPIEGVFEDDKGLFGTAEVNLDVQQGKEVFSLAKQKVIVDFSVGFSVKEFDMKEGLRIIEKASIWEGSATDEPMNIDANIIDVKTATPFKNLPIADRDRPWDASKAISNVKAFTDSTENPSGNYKDAFFWYDRANKEDFGAYKLPFADVINGKLTAVPRGIFAAAAAMQGARGGVDIPDTDRAAVEKHMNRYYDKMDLESPFEKSGLGITEIEIMSKKDMEDHLKKTFSRKGAKFLASKFVTDQREAESDEQCDAVNVKELNEALTNLKKTITKE